MLPGHFRILVGQTIAQIGHGHAFQIHAHGSPVQFVQLEQVVHQPLDPVQIPM